MGTIWVQCSVICAMKSERKIEEEKNKVKVETTTNRYEGTIKSNESQRIVKVNRKGETESKSPITDRKF